MIVSHFGYQGNISFNARALTNTLGRNTKNKNSTAELNSIDIYNELLTAANVFCSRFKWRGKYIDNLSPGYIEKLLFWNGFCIGFIHNTSGFMILPATIQSRNYMNEPVLFNAVGNGFNYEVDIDNCVMIRDTYLFYPPYDVIYRYACMCADINRTFEVYGKGMKKPVIISTTDKQAYEHQIITQKILDNEAYLLMGRGKDDINDTPPVFHNTEHNSQDWNGIMLAKKTLYNEMLSKIGINVPLINKNTYRNDMEIQNEYMHIELILQQSWECRKKAAKELSEMIGDEIVCENVAVDIKADDTKEGGSIKENVESKVDDVKKEDSSEVVIEVKKEEPSEVVVGVKVENSPDEEKKTDV